MKGFPWYVAWSYFAYCVFWGSLVWGGIGYVVFWRGESGWWFALAVLLGEGSFKPHRWAMLFDGVKRDVY